MGDGGFAGVSTCLLSPAFLSHCRDCGAAGGFGETPPSVSAQQRMPGHDLVIAEKTAAIEPLLPAGRLSRA